MAKMNVQEKIVVDRMPAVTTPQVREIVFPNMAERLNVKEGEAIRFKLPAGEIRHLAPLRPEPGGYYQGQPVFTAFLRYKVDGGPIEERILMEPHNTGQGGYKGIDLKDVDINIPNGAKHVRYWFEGRMAGRDIRYHSNYGADYHLDVQQPQPQVARGHSGKSSFGV